MPVVPQLAPRGARAAPRWAGALGMVLGLEYGVGKLVMAGRGELGVPGHPAPRVAYDGSIDVVPAQLANAALGFAAAVLALLITFSIGRRVPAVFLTTCAALVLAAQVGSLLVVGASLVGWRDDHGQWGTDSLVLALASVVTWAVLLRGARGARHPPGVG